MKAVITETQNSVLEIIFNKPENRNAMDMDFFLDFKEALEEAKSPDIRAVLLRGEGPAFSVGGNIRFFRARLEEGEGIPESAPDELHAMIELMRTLDKPVLACAHGACAGAGLSLVLACDLAIVAESTKFNLAYAGIGLSPDGGSTYFLPRHVGLKRATEIFMTGRTMNASEVLDLGLVNRVVPDEDLLSEARTFAQMLAMGPTAAFGRIKKLLLKTFDNDLKTQLALESKLFSESSFTEDFKNGVRAFLAKEMPQYQGR
jgi:2-(1,2-epoxy-1,2-dihydrophenyl)acetyl-CoA isomerase